MVLSASRDLSGRAEEPVLDGPHCHEWTARHDGGALETGDATGHYAHLTLALADLKEQIEAKLHPLVEAAKERGSAEGGPAREAEGIAVDGDGEDDPDGETEGAEDDAPDALDAVEDAVSGAEREAGAKRVKRSGKD